MNVAFRVLQDVVIIVHGADPPSNEEWEAWLNYYVQEAAEDRLPIYVVTEGGGPDVNQRDSLNRRFSKIKPRAAVVTSSRVARGIITALQWVGQIDLKGFAPEKRHEALVFLGVRPDMLKAIDAAVRDMQREIQTTISVAPRAG
jgi:hypothetical protein